MLIEILPKYRRWRQHWRQRKFDIFKLAKKVRKTPDFDKKFGVFMIAGGLNLHFCVENFWLPRFYPW
jgi:hypothetical protein